ncbi:MAG: glucokinase, partial [Pseudomonadota bacterium]
MSAEILLCGDLGGTRARFALFAAGATEPIWTQTVAAADFPTPQAAARAVIDAEGGPPPTVCAMAVAAPPHERPVRFTNNAWTLHPDAFGAALGTPPPLVLGDFEALALGVGGTPGRRAPRLVIGPGTGLGVASAAPVGETGWIAISGQGGHAEIAPGDAFEAEILNLLRRGLGRVRAEDVVSGPGLVKLIGAVAALEGEPPPPSDPAEALAAAPDDALRAVASLFGGCAGDQRRIAG